MPAAELDALNRDGVTPLGIACAAGNWRLARFLLERGAQARTRRRPAGAARRGRHARKTMPPACSCCSSTRPRSTRATRAAAARCTKPRVAGHVEIVGALLAAGADAHARDSHGRTPLLEAARGGHLAVLERLLAQLPKAARRSRDRRRATAATR